MKVNLFIVGAPKAGTSSLHYYLSQHPGVSMSSIKEPNYFTSAEINGLYPNYGGIEKTMDESEYHALFLSKGPIFGEASVSYLFYPQVAEKLHRYNPEAKIVIAIRDPVDRAISHCAMDQRLGFSTATLESVFADPERYKTEFQQYFQLGLYSEQIERYRKVFPPENVLLLVFDDLHEDENTVIKKVFDFVGITKLDIDISRENVAVVPRGRLTAYLYRNPAVRKFLKGLLPNDVRSIVEKIFLSGNKKNDGSKLSTEMKAKMYDYFKNDLKNLEENNNLNLSAWHSKYQ